MYTRSEDLQALQDEFQPCDQADTHTCSLERVKNGFECSPVRHCQVPLEYISSVQ